MNTYNWADVPDNMPAEQLEMLTEARLKGLLFDGRFLGSHGPSFVEAHQLGEVSISYVGPTGRRTHIIASAGQLTTYKA